MYASAPLRWAADIVSSICAASPASVNGTSSAIICVWLPDLAPLLKYDKKRMNRRNFLASSAESDLEHLGMWNLPW